MYKFIYDIEFSRTIPAVLKDSRASIPEIKNKIGSVIKAYTDVQVGEVGDNVVPYKIETVTGVLAGYFTVLVKGGFGSQFQYQLRPAFVQFNAVISAEISIFIASDSWRFDYLGEN